MIFLFHHKKNAEIHGNRFRTHSQCNFPSSNEVAQAAVVIINICYDEQPDFNAVHCHLSPQFAVKWVLFFITLLKSIHFVTLAVTVVVSFLNWKLTLEKPSLLVWCVAVFCLHAEVLELPADITRDHGVDGWWWLVQWICVDLISLIIW